MKCIKDIDESLDEFVLSIRSIWGNFSGVPRFLIATILVLVFAFVVSISYIFAVLFLKWKKE